MTVTTVAAPVVAPATPTTTATTSAPAEGEAFAAALDAALSTETAAGDPATVPGTVDGPATTTPAPAIEQPDGGRPDDVDGVAGPDALPDVPGPGVEHVGARHAGAEHDARHGHWHTPPHDGTDNDANAATPATPAMPATPAIPATRGEGEHGALPATPAVRAVAAEPAIPAARDRADQAAGAATGTAADDAASFVPAVPDVPTSATTHSGTESSGTPALERPEPTSTHASPQPGPDAAPSPVLGVPTAAPAAATTSPQAAGPAAPVEIVPAHVAEQLSTHLRGVRRTTDGRHEATLVLDPEHLGPVRVRLTLDDGALHLQLSGLQASTGDALRDALPDLRRQLAEAGLTLGSADVTDHGSWDGRDGRPQEPSPRRSTHGPMREHAVAAVPVAAPPRPHRTGGVDLVV